MINSANGGNKTGYNMAKESFLFFSNMRDVIKSVPREKQLELREAIENYVFDGVEPEDWAFRAIIQSLKPLLCKGGRGAPVGNNNARKENENNSDNPNNTDVLNDLSNCETKKSIQTIQNKKINSNKKNNSVNCLNCETKKTKAEEKRKKEKTPPAPPNKEINKKITLSGDNAPARNAADGIIFQSISGWFNENIAERYGIPPVKKALPDRIHRLRDRIDEAGSVEEFKRIVETSFSESGFLRGEKGGFSADFDAVCSEKIFSKMREGGYRDNKARPKACDPWGEGVPL